MKYVQRLLLLLSLLFMVPSMAQEVYELDKNHSFVVWRVSHFDFSDVIGKFLVSGTLQFDPQKPQNSRLKVDIDMSSMNTGIPKLDKILAGGTFFDATQFSTATFVSDKVTVTGKTTGKISGKLTIKGVTKPLELSARLRKTGPHPFNGRPTLGFVATGQLLRSDFGMRGYLPGVGDDVQLELQIEAIQPKKPESES